MLRALKQRVPGGDQVAIPAYFRDRRYQSISRYPHPTSGLVVPATFIPDLDTVFTSLIGLVPFQHNTELRKTLRKSGTAIHEHLIRSNASLPALAHLLGETLTLPTA